MEEFGWDKQERSYFVLDDSRMYRLTKPTPKTQKQAKPKPKPKAKAKPPPPKSKGSRSSKRQKMADGDSKNDDDLDQQEIVNHPDEETEEEEEQDENNGLGGAKWECIAVSSDDYVNFINTIRKSKDQNEKDLVRRMQDEIMPEIERQAASRERKEAQQRRELMNLERLATAKRSSRLAGKQEQIKEQQGKEEAERKKREELAMAHREQAKQQKMEHARESRMMTREQRLKERDVKRILHEEELKRLEEQDQDSSSAEGRISERQRKTEMEKKKLELQKWTEGEGEWYFDCAICGVHGKNLDDGTHSIACDKCDTWQHSACHGIKEDAADKDDFQFLCASCSQPRTIKVKSSSKSPDENKQKRKLPTDGAADSDDTLPFKKHVGYTVSDTPDAQPAVVVQTQRPPEQHWKISPHMNAHHASQPRGDPHLQTSTNVSPSDHSSSRAPHSPTQTNGVQHGRRSPSKERFPTQRPPSANGHDPSRNAFQKQSRPISSPRPSSSSSANVQAAGGLHGSQLGHFASPYPRQTVHQNATPQSSAQNQWMTSPTPSLSATQGQTNIRFSPASQTQPGHAHTYMPNNNNPSPAGYSPMKQHSPASSSHGLSNAQQSSSFRSTSNGHKASHSNGAINAPTLQSSSPNQGDRAAGISPTKHDMPPSSPSFAGQMQHPKPSPQPEFEGLGNSPTKSMGSPLPRPSNVPTISSPPSLQPNVGTENGTGKALEPPVKKDIALPGATAHQLNGV